MTRFRVATSVNKIGDNNAILIKDIVNESVDYDRNYGMDGTDFRCKNGDPEKVIDIAAYTGIRFLRLEAVWDETDENIQVVKGSPAPFEYQLNNGQWVKLKRVTFEDIESLTALKLRNPDNVNGKYIKIKVTLASTGMA